MDNLIILAIIIGSIFLVTQIILGIFLPFFVLKIRNQVVQINKTIKIMNERSS